MLAKCFHIESRPILGPVTLIALALLLLPSVASPESNPGRRVNECNSDILIDVAPTMLAVNQTATVTLTVTNTLSRDAADMGIDQVVDNVTYTGHCQTPPGLPCDSEVTDNAFAYLGSVGGSCPGVVPNEMNGVVTFDFVPDLVLTTPTPAAEVSCTITFDVAYTAAGDFPIQTTTMGVCQGGTFQSDTTVTSAVTVSEPVPTTGEVALAILALLLVGGAWLTLRRRNALPRV